MKDWKTIGLVTACVIGTVALGELSGMASPRDEWYAAVRKPSWAPPGWVFGVVWPLLYATLGEALALVLIKGWQAGGVRGATRLFAIQLALNLAWSPVFFRFHSIGGALAIVVVLWLLTGWTVAAFWSVRDVAGVLLLPYWAWVTFAVGLNGAIWRMN